MQIDPKQVTNFSRTDAELQAFFLFTLMCAGKNSDVAARTLSKLLHKCDTTPFEYFRSLGETGIHNALVVAKAGQYTRLTKAIMQGINLDLKTCSLEDLLNVHGIGMKSARFILLHSREGCRYACLDVHILRWLRDHGVDAPIQTPTQPKEYDRLEKAFLYLTNIHFPFMTLAQIDLIIWMDYSGRLEKDLTEPLLSSYSPFEDPQEEHESFA